MTPARFPVALAVASLAIALLVPTFPLWSGGAYPIWDAASFYAPAWTLVADAAREGRPLLWNLWLSGGRPEAADPQVGALSPVVVAAAGLLGPSLRGFVAYFLGLWLAAAVGTLLLARHLGAPLWGALAAAAGILGSGFLVVHAQHTAFVASFAALPWILWRLDVALRDRRWVGAAEAGALWGLSGVGGYPAILFLNGAFAALWALGRGVCGGDDAAGGVRTAGRPPVATLLRAGLVAGVLGAVVLAPTYVLLAVEGPGFSDRLDPLPRERAIHENALHPAALATFFSPRLAVAPVHAAEVWGFSGYSMASCYTGAATLVLALVALAGRPRSAFRWWLAGAAALAIALALGGALPLRGWLYDAVPPTRFFRHAGVFRGPALLAVAVLAALGSRDREGDEKAWDGRVARTSLAVGAAGAAALLAVRATPFFTPYLRLRYVALAVALGLAPAACVALGALLGRRRLVPPLLALVALADAAAAIGVARSFVFDAHPSSIGHWEASLAARRDDPHRGVDQTGRGLDRRATARFGDGLHNRNAIAHEAVLSSYDPVAGPLIHLFAEWPVLRAATTGPDRVWFSPVAAVEPAGDRTFVRLARRAEALGAPVLVVHPREDGATPAASVPFQELPAMTRPAFVLLEYRPERLRLRVEAPDDGWLWVTDRWARGWRVTVDGETRPVWRAGLLFRGVEVRAGRREVDFTYRAAGHPWLFAASAAALLALAGAAAFRALRGRQGRTAARAS